MRRLFQENLELINRISAKVCSKNGYYGADAEDFASLVRVKFLEKDCARLRKFVGRSSLKTYITTVISNLFYDERIRRWGKFRPSVVTKKGGEVARLLEILLYRERRSFDEAVRILQSEHKVEESEAQLAELAGRIPPRLPRLWEGVEQLEELPIDGEVEHRLLAREKADLAVGIKKILAQGLGRLPKEDQLVLRMHFEDGFTIARIAKVLGLKQRPLYSRVDRCLKDLRACLEKEGVGSEEALSLVGWDGDKEE